MEDTRVRGVWVERGGGGQPGGRRSACEDTVDF